MTGVRVLVVDDSRSARALLRAVLAADEQIAVVGEAGSGAEAVALVGSVRPTLVVMDVNMPGVDGFEATRRIMAEHPTPIVIVTAGVDARLVETGLEALRAGALTVTPKPAGPTSPAHGADAARLVTLVKALADVKVVRQRRRPGAPDSGPPAVATPPAIDLAAVVRVVGVAASTGGPAALYRFLAALPPTLDVPVLVVQHIAKGFVDGLARWLDTGSSLPVHVAGASERLRSGEVHLAPDDRHLVVRSDRLALSDAPSIGGFRPSADVLFESLARSHGPNAAAVVLTGMGHDGLRGAEQLRDVGGLVLAQDAASSVVFGMPEAVARHGIAHAVGPVEELARRIAAHSSPKEERA